MSSTIDRTRPTRLHYETEFLFSGGNPIQIGLDLNEIYKYRLEQLGIVRGRVLDTNQAPLPAVKIEVLGNPLFGYTYSRLNDAVFDMAVRGDGWVTLMYTADGYVPVQRTLWVNAQEFNWAPDVVMTELGQSTLVSAGNVVALGSTETDQSGSRQASVYFPSGFQYFINGAPQSGPINVRVTEVTVGELGPLAMPARLPSTSAYTYAVDISLDEASAPMDVVEFDETALPVVYVDVTQFMQSGGVHRFPTGTVIPVGWYNRSKGVWEAEPNGIVIEIVGTDAGGARLDLDGDGDCDANDEARYGEFDITAEERMILAGSPYSAGTRLWRVRVSHFSTYDCNWPFDSNAAPPSGGSPSSDNDSGGCDETGSIITCQPQILGQRVAIAGTKDTLNYRSHRVQGRVRAFTVDVPLTGADLPGTDLRRIDLEVNVAGKQYQYAFTPQSADCPSTSNWQCIVGPVNVANKLHQVTWDGLDAYGRRLQGAQPARVRVGYVYAAVYTGAAGEEEAFSLASDGGGYLVPDETRDLVTWWQDWKVNLGLWDAQGLGLGGWSHSKHHVYDPVARTLHLGTGVSRTADRYDVPSIIERAMGYGTYECDDTDHCGPYPSEYAPFALDTKLVDPVDVAIGPDQAYYVSHNGDTKAVLRANTLNHGALVELFVGCYDQQQGDPSGCEPLNRPTSLAFGPDGSLYVVDEYWDTVANVPRILRVAPDGTVERIAGDPSQDDCDPPWDPSDIEDCGEGVPAVDARLPNGDITIAVAPDGSIYVAEKDLHRVRRIGTNGIITTVAGTGDDGFNDVGSPLLGTDAELSNPMDVAVGPDGNLYICDNGNERIRRLDATGHITVVAGTPPGASPNTDDSDGIPALDAKIHCESLTVDRDGSIYFTEFFTTRVRKITPDGIVRTLAGRLTDTGAPDACGVGDDPYNCSDPECNAPGPYCGDNGPAKRARIGDQNLRGINVSPDGEVYIVEGDRGLVRRIRPSMPGFSLSNILLPSRSGSRLYQFDKWGRHLGTHSLYNSTASAVPVHTFNYENPGDPDGNYGRLTGVVDADGNETTLTYNSGQVYINTQWGVSSTIYLDGHGYASQYTNQVPETHLFDLGSDGLMTSMTDPKGYADHTGAKTYTYDSLGRLETALDPVGGSKALSRNDLSNGYEVTLETVATAVPPVTHTKTYRVTTDSAGVTTRRTTFPSGLYTESSITGDGKTSTVYPDGTEVQRTSGPHAHWGMNNPVTEESWVIPPDPTGPVLRQTFETVEMSVDWPNQFHSETHNIGLFTDPSASAPNRIYTVSYSSGSGTSTWQTLTPGGILRRVHYDDKGRPIEIEQSGRATRYFTYQSAQGNYPGAVERVHSVSSQGEVREIIIDYGADGNPSMLHTLVDETGPDYSTVDFLDYDNAGRLTDFSLPGQGNVSLGYDENGNVENISTPSQTDHGFGFTPMNRLDAYQPPSGDPTTATYQKDGKLKILTLGNGAAITLGYDTTSGKLESISMPSWAIDVTRHPSTQQFHTIGRNVSSTDPVTLTYSWNGMLLETEATSGSVAGSVEFGYDNLFRRASTTVHADVSSTINFTYDLNSLLETAESLTITRDPSSGVPTQVSLPGGYRAEIDTSEFGEVDGITSYRWDGSVYYNYTETVGSRDRKGRILERSEWISGWGTKYYQYSYTQAGQLSTVHIGGTLREEYVYDENGNRELAAYYDANGALDAEYDGYYDDQDRIESYGDCEYAFDDAGFILSHQYGAIRTRFTYDSLGNLLQVDSPVNSPSDVVDYIVDGRNRRVARKLNGNVTHQFLYQDQLNPVAELDANGDLVSHFVYATRGHVPDYMIKNGVAYFIVSDHLGSVRTVMNTSTGATAQQLTYDAFGRVLEDTNPGFQPFGFAGGLYDPTTGLVRFGARDYDPEIGRWISRDPILFGGGDTNLYSYVGQDPVNYIDPWGLINLMKYASGLLNYANAGRQLAHGTFSIMAALGLLEAPPAGIAVGLWGMFNMYSATSSLDRGNKQCSEAWNEDLENGDWKNFAGLLPFGTEADDLDEPNYLDMIWGKIEGLRTGDTSIWEAIRQFGSSVP